jgi:choline dehydrogenase-like flavoprotein
MSVAEFDGIIVGAGSAGCALANRLSASGEQRVLRAAEFPC